MANPKVELNFTDLLKMGDEVKAKNGPGSESWDANSSSTKHFNELYMKALRENQGKVPGELEVIPSLIITTIGAKTGEKRAVPLAYQIIDGRLIIVASMAGADRHPPWFHNLAKNPEVLVEMNGESFKATAVVTEGSDRTHLYNKVAEVLPAFAEYATRTTRVIPVVELKRQS